MGEGDLTWSGSAPSPYRVLFVADGAGGIFASFLFLLFSSFVADCYFLETDAGVFVLWLGPLLSRGQADREAVHIRAHAHAHTRLALTYTFFQSPSWPSFPFPFGTFPLPKDFAWSSLDCQVFYAVSATPRISRPCTKKTLSRR
jgi:hypothetical protein